LDADGTELAGKYMFFNGKGKGYQELGTGYSVHLYQQLSKFSL
jgi:hypothetical protein